MHGHRAVRTLLGMMAAITIAGMPAASLDALLCGRHLSPRLARHGDSDGGDGRRCASPARSCWHGGRVYPPCRKVIFWSALLLGAGFCFFAWSNVFYYSLAVMPLIGYSVMRQMASANTLIQTLIPG